MSTCIILSICYRNLISPYVFAANHTFLQQAVPQNDAFNRAFNKLTPATLKAINEIVVRSAVALGLEDGKKLRVDTTVVKTDIRHPTDSTLLWDSVRVITRLVGKMDLCKFPIYRSKPIQGCSKIS
jgi:hypothetical protein